jgi:hypothetical protein
MNKEELEKFIALGKQKTEIKEIEFDDIPMHQQVTLVVSQLFFTVEHSKSIGVLWDSFEKVINKASKKKYVDECKMKQSMNTMLFNELRKSGIAVRRTNHV